MLKNTQHQSQKATWEKLLSLWFVDKVHRILEVAQRCLSKARVDSVGMTLTPSPLLCINITIPLTFSLCFRLSDWPHQKNESEAEKQTPLTTINLVQHPHFIEWTTNIQREERMSCLATTSHPCPS